MNGRRRIDHCPIHLGLVFWLLVAECWLVSGFASAEENPNQIGELAVRASSAGTNAYVSGKWSVLRLNLTNPTRQPVEVLAATYFEDEPTLQFGRRCRGCKPGIRFCCRRVLRVGVKNLNSAR